MREHMHSVLQDLSLPEEFSSSDDLSEAQAGETNNPGINHADFDGL
jgi:hypothetical protein